MFFKRIPSLSTQELASLLVKKPLLIDVRESVDFQKAHIPGAKNVPLAKITAYKPAGPTYVICQSGLRSKQATKILISKGYEAKNVRGGMSAWTGPTRGGKL